jgi:hypothetical protein
MTPDELLSCVLNLAQRAGAIRSMEEHLAHETDFRQGRRTEVRRTINDATLASVSFLEELRRATEQAQSAIIADLPAAASGGPTLTELGKALGISKQSGRKRAQVAAAWSAAHDVPTVSLTIEELAERYPAVPSETWRPQSPAAPKMHWPDDGTIPPDVFGNTVDPQQSIANKAYAVGLGVSGYR